MLSKEERISIRNKLYESFISLFILTINIKTRINHKKLSSLLNDKNNELTKLYNLYIKEFNSNEEALYCIKKLDDYTNHICPICNRTCLFNTNDLLYRTTCGRKECIDKFSLSKKDMDSIIQKRKESVLNKYGVDNVSKIKEVRDKAKSTMKKLYGVENPMFSEKLKEKQHKVIKDKYKVDNVFQADIIKEKIKNTNIEKYGVEFPNQNKKIFLKVVETNKALYGCNIPTQNKDIYKKVKETNLERYGVDNPSKSNIVKEKIRKTYKDNNEIEFSITDGDIKNTLEAINLEEDISNIYYKDEYFISFIQKLYELKDRQIKLKELSNFFNISSISLKKRILNLNLLKYIDIKDSKYEKIFKSFLDKNNIKYIRRDKSILSNNSNKLELDFLLPDYNIAFEINDLASHNIIQKDYLYHHNKSIQSFSHNIYLIHIWEWELVDLTIFNRLSNYIINLLENNKYIIDGKDCNIIEVPIINAIEFINNYNIYNYSTFSDNKYIGLYNERDELIQLISLRNNNTIVNMTTKYGYIIKDGYKVLLEYVINAYNINYLLYHSDLSKDNTKELINMGFTLYSYIDPQIIWYNEDNHSIDFTSFDNKENKIYFKNKSVYNSGIQVYKYEVVR